MKIITVYRGYRTDGYAGWESGVYRTYQEALEFGTDFPEFGHNKAIERKAIELEDGTIWLLEKDGKMRFSLEEEAKKKTALAKLTPEEKEILGIKE
jgi:hypothetical protein